MNVKKSSDAMNELDSKYIDEALNYSATKKSGRFSPKWIRRCMIAACLCVALVIGVLIQPPNSNVVTSSGFLTITAYAASSDEELVMQEGIELPVDYNWSLAMSSRPGLPLKLTTSEHPNATFEVSVEGGTLFLWESNQISYLESPFNAENGTTIYWTNLSRTNGNNFDRYSESEAYISIIIREEENIIGYAVVQIYTNDMKNEPAQNYSAKLLKSVSFPMVNGTYQKITSEYIATEIENVRGRTMKFRGQVFNKDELSSETIKWLEWYNALPLEDQLAVNSIPRELYTHNNSTTADTDANAEE